MGAVPLTLRMVARALGGEVSGGQVLAPGPQHSRTDRSMTVRLSLGGPDGFVVHSHCGDDWRACRDYVRQRLGLALWVDVTKRKPGAPEDTPRDPETGRLMPNVDNIHERPERPSGTSAAAGIRKLQKAAAEGNEDDGRIQIALDLWAASVDPRGTAVETYFRSRRLEIADLASRVIRWNARIGAAVALFRSIATGEARAVSRTYLDPEGRKIERKFLGAVGGAAVMLDGFGDVTHGLHVGEGVETCQAARQLGLRPTWALGSAGGVSTFPVLAGVECLTILAELDLAGARAAEVCAARWHEAGREVLLNRPTRGKDLNDAIRGEVA